MDHRDPDQKKGLTRREWIHGALAGTAFLAARCAGSAGGSAPGGKGKAKAAPAPGSGPFKLEKLPYAPNALEPHISGRTMGFHYGKHHAGYVRKLNAAVQGSPMASMSVEEIITLTAGKDDKKGVFNNAAQAFNHAFYWQSMTPKGGGTPPSALAARIKADFGGFESFRQAFTAAAATQFGSGWAWLVLDGGKLKVISTSNADTPLAHRKKPLLTIDVWEHAYYLDYQNRREAYIRAYLDHLVDWDWAARRFVQS